MVTSAKGTPSGKVSGGTKKGISTFPAYRLRLLALSRGRAPCGTAPAWRGQGVFYVAR